MKNITKIIFASLASLALFVVPATSGELTVTGAAKATYNIIKGGDHTTAGNGLSKGMGVANEISFGANGELDNGWTWTYGVDFDPSDGATAASDGNANGVDDSKLTVTTGYGTVGMFITEGGLRAENKGSQSVYSRPTDIGLTTGINTTGDIDGYSNMQYHTPAGLLPFETSLKIGYSTGGENQINSSNATGESSGQVAGGSPDSVEQYQITTSPIDGLNIYADYFKENGSQIVTALDTVITQQMESGGVAATCTFGAATIGASRSLETPTISRTAVGTAATDVREMEQNKMSVSYVVNDNTSVSYEEERGERELVNNSATNDYKGESLQVAHTMGGMTLAVVYSEHENLGYRINNDVEQVLFAATMAF
jgi:hypothetical protein